MSDLIKRLFSAFSLSKKSPLHSYLHTLEEKIGYSFRDKETLIEALTHRSILGDRKENPRQITYERLEFLGDSVLSLVTSDFLIREFPQEDEGQLTKKKSLLVSKGVLSKKAEEIGLKKYLIMSENALKGGVAEQDSVQASVLEAIIGAIYIDSGIKEAKNFTLRFVLNDIESLLSHRDHINYKSALQELSQARFKSYPSYTIKSTMGPEHDKIFLVEVRINGNVLGSGRGKSKKDAEQMAAKEALSKLEAGDKERE